MALDEQQKNLIEECIESHRRMIKHHRAQILELSRQLINHQEHTFESFDLEIKK